MYFIQNTTIKHFTHHLFSTNIFVRSLHIIFAWKDYPPSSPCGVPVTWTHLFEPHVLLYFMWVCWMILWLIIIRNILRVSIFDCSGFLCAREYHFLSEVQKNRLEWTKLSVLFLRFFWTVFCVYFCTICTNSV